MESDTVFASTLYEVRGYSQGHIGRIRLIRTIMQKGGAWESTVPIKNDVRSSFLDSFLCEGILSCRM